MYMIDLMNLMILMNFMILMTLMTLKNLMILMKMESIQCLDWHINFNGHSIILN